MSNTGLLISHAFNENVSMQNEVAKNILSDKLNINNGMFLENIVAQMFQANNKKLYFYSRLDNENSKNTIEIDFLITDIFDSKKISPVEVKSGKYYTISSLTKFNDRFKRKLEKNTYYILKT